MPDDTTACTACVNGRCSHGKKCHVCDGTGRVPQQVKPQK
ncbi:hypothetical protein FHS44_004527 [Streptosporangium saharense]|uniref:Uncharacterized protein n=1 Tax=Streptosporangium saharense TaxID=1706840 RepID=A0A7W7QPX7_9ACTN|nr:hypothetical protein [Streptosporangium saharense]